MRLNDSIIPTVELMNADAVLNAFDEIDRENRTNNAIAHPASCRGARLHAAAGHTVPTVREVATDESRYREHTVARLAP